MKEHQYNIALAVTEWATSMPDALAIALPNKNSHRRKRTDSFRRISFASLSKEIQCAAKGLVAAGFERGERVIVLVPPGEYFFVLAFAMLQTGIIPVFIDPSIGLKNMKKCIAEVEPVGFIGISRAHIARILFRWGAATIRKKISADARLFWSGKTMSWVQNFDRTEKKAPFFEAGPDDMAAIIFTSGSTGKSKGVVYAHGNFKAQLEMARNAFQFAPGEIDLPTFPPFALLNPAMGVSSIIPDINYKKPASIDPKKIIGTIQQFNITTMFGSPAVLNAVGRYGAENGIVLPSLKRVISAGAPVPVKTLKRFSSMLAPEAQIYTPYGATESMPVSKVGSDKIFSEFEEKTKNGGGICIGKPVEGMEVAIIRIDDTEIAQWSEDIKLPDGEVGEIVVKGLNVTKSYYNRTRATQLAKIADGDQVRHRMGDLGYFDEEGNLWFCGRKAHRVNTRSEELYTIQCEHIFNKHPNVFRTALVGVDGEAVLCVECEKEAGRIDRNKLRNELLAMAAAHPLTTSINTVLFHPGFPVDIRHNAKIIREELAVWAKKKLT